MANDLIFLARLNREPGPVARHRIVNEPNDGPSCSLIGLSIELLTLWR